MKVLILTSAEKGIAPHHLQGLLGSQTIQVCAVICAAPAPIPLKRRLKKMLKIGLRGALNGIRMRKWFGEDAERYLSFPNLETLCKENRIPFHRTAGIRAEETLRAFRESGAELGISLGNGYIPKRIFSALPKGMINIHHEILPDFANAQSVIWQLYKGSDKTGYSIHKVSAKIDAGDLLLVEETPIAFYDTLAETVARNVARLFELSAAGLRKVLEQYEAFESHAKQQSGGASFTTPTLAQFREMDRQFNRLRAAAKGREDKKAEKSVR